MKTIFKNILKAVGVEWMVKTVMISALEALRDAVIESETKWDDRIALKLIDGVLLGLKEGETPDLDPVER